MRGIKSEYNSIQSSCHIYNRCVNEIAGVKKKRAKKGVNSYYHVPAMTTRCE